MPPKDPTSPILPSRSVDNAAAIKGRRLSRWPYWVFIPLATAAYTAFCFFFALEAWGRRGEVKPQWFIDASRIAGPGGDFPVLGPIGPGAIAGFVIAFLIQRLRLIRHRSRNPPGPHVS